MVPVLPVTAGSQAVGSFDIEGGSTNPTFAVKYLRFGIWHHFVYQSPSSCLRDYCNLIGLDYHTDIVRESVRAHDVAIELGLERDLDPRFSRTNRIDVVVSYRRHGYIHSFGFEAQNDGGLWLEQYVRMLGMKMSDIKIKVLNSPVTA